MPRRDSRTHWEGLLRQASLVLTLVAPEPHEWIGFEFAFTANAYEHDNLRERLGLDGRS